MKPPLVNLSIDVFTSVHFYQCIQTCFDKFINKWLNFRSAQICKSLTKLYNNAYCYTFINKLTKLFFTVYWNITFYNVKFVVKLEIPLCKLEYLKFSAATKLTCVRNKNPFFRFSSSPPAHLIAQENFSGSFLKIFTIQKINNNMSLLNCTLLRNVLKTSSFSEWQIRHTCLFLTHISTVLYN